MQFLHWMRGVRYSSQISKYILHYIYICVMNYMKIIFGLFLEMFMKRILRLSVKLTTIFTILKSYLIFNIQILNDILRSSFQ